MSENIIARLTLLAILAPALVEGRVRFFPLVSTAGILEFSGTDFPLAILASSTIDGVFSVSGVDPSDENDEVASASASEAALSSPSSPTETSPSLF